MKNNYCCITHLLIICCIGFVSCGKNDTTKNNEYSFEKNMVYNAVTDYDGNSYDAVKIGGKIWLTKSIRTTHFADGSPIKEGTGYSEDTALYYHVNNNAANDEEYGLLYNWKAAMDGAAGSALNPSGVQGLCPDGWHLPSDAEWTALTDSVSAISNCACGIANITIAKSLASNKGWATSSYTCAVGNDQNSNNATCFAAMPAGFFQGPENAFGTQVSFWTTTESDSVGVWYRNFYYHSATVRRYISPGKKIGFSVRCVKD